MSQEALRRSRKRPTGPLLSFVIYERKTGSILGMHQILTYEAPSANAILTEQKQRAAAKAVTESVLKRVALASGLAANRLAVLAARRLDPGDLAGARIDVKRRRLIRTRASSAARLSTLNLPRRRG
jgi:hypothetical protein